MREYIRYICTYTRHVCEITHALVCVFASHKESKEAERLNGVTTRQSHRFGIVWTKPSKSTANRPRFASLYVSITISLPCFSTRTRGPSFFRYISWGALPSSSHPIPFLRRTIERNTAETLKGKLWIKKNNKNVGTLISRFLKISYDYSDKFNSFGKSRRSLGIIISEKILS